MDLSSDKQWAAAKRTIDINSFRPARVEFTDDKTVVVTFMRYPEGREPGHKSDLIEPVVLEARFYDAQDGHLRGTLHWIARRDAGQLRAIHDGAFLVHAGDKILRYSTDLKLVKERDLVPPALAANGGLQNEWQMEIAPGGRVGYLRFRAGSNVTHFWIDVDTLMDSYSVRMNSGWTGIVAEDAIATRKSAKGSEPSEVLLWERGKDWRRIATGHTVGTFLADDLLLIYSQREFQVLNREGKVFLHGPLTYDDPSELQVRRNLDGTWFAINDSHRAVPILQKHGFFDWNFKVIAGNAKTHQIFSQINLGTQDSRQVDIALSPDGARLATLTGSKLSVFNLP